MPDSASDSPAAELSTKRWHITRRDIVYSVIVITLAVVAIVLVRTKTSDEMDYDFKNVLTFGGAALGVIFVVGWFWFRSPLPWLLKFLVPIGVIGVLAVLFRIDNFKGDMNFDIVFRFQAKPDELLETNLPADDLGRQLAAATADDYPRFLGSDLRATVTGLNLETDWQTHPPREVWRQPIGAGWSGFAVAGDYAVTQEQRGEQEMVTCYELQTGKLVWIHADTGRHSELLGGDGPRATPTIDGNKVYTQGGFGILNCLDLLTGERYWSRNLVSEFSAKHINFGRSGSPLIEQQMVIVSAGGPNGKSLLAFDKGSGKLLWQAGDDRSSYASPIAVTLAGTRQIVSVNEGWVRGHQATNGEILWQYEWPSNSDNDAASSQPVPLDEDLMLFTKGYGHGLAIVRISQENAKFNSKEIIRQPTLMKTKMSNVVIYDGHVYGLSGGILECVHLESGKRKWKGGRYGHGQIMRIDDSLLVVSEKGDLVLVAAQPERFQERTRIKALSDKTWNNPALAGRLLLVRNHLEAACYELPVKESPASNN